MGKRRTKVCSSHRKHGPNTSDGSHHANLPAGNSAKTVRDSKHRFGNLFGLLNRSFLLDSWRALNKRAAPGIDRVDAREYGRDLEEHVDDLVERLKAGQYHAKLIRRQYILKGKNERRPLGIPSVEDKLLQTGAKRILEAMYEPKFLDCSFGYRPGIGPRDAVKDLTETLQFGRYFLRIEKPCISEQAYVS